MPSYTVRVELHNSDDYVTLHKAMKKEGFKTTIKFEKKPELQLPTAEYIFTGKTTGAKVKAKAINAAKTVIAAFAILVTKSSGRWEHGLNNAKPVKKS